MTRYRGVFKNYASRFGGLNQNADTGAGADNLRALLKLGGEVVANSGLRAQKKE